MTTLYRIVLADDHLLFREMVKKSIEEIPGLNVVGEAGDGLALLELMKTLTPDMVILDITMPYLQGTDAAKEIKAAYPQVKILILTMHKSREHVYRAIASGADGFLLKDNAYQDLIAAIDTLRQGRSYISSLVSGHLTDIIRQKGAGAGLDLEEPLSPREVKVLTLLAEGKSSKEIAEQLSISILTVNNHRKKIKGKLKMRKHADLVKYAIQRGYTSADLE